MALSISACASCSSSCTTLKENVFPINLVVRRCCASPDATAALLSMDLRIQLFYKFLGTGILKSIPCVNNFAVSIEQECQWERTALIVLIGQFFIVRFLVGCKLIFLLTRKICTH